MTTYVDTSAFLAIANAGDPKHDSAERAWAELVGDDEVLVISSYVLIETITLLHSRYGTQIVEEFLRDVLPLVETVWADVPMHNATVIAMLACPGKSGPSLVDCMSLEVIRQRRITDVFAYDRHFEGRGLKLLG